MTATPARCCTCGQPKSRAGRNDRGEECPCGCHLGHDPTWTPWADRDVDTP